MTEDLAAELARADGLLLLCSGNMVRSAFAELYARHLGCPLPVRSAAASYRNPSLHPETDRALAARGVSEAERRAFRPRMLEDLDPPAARNELVLGMTPLHLAAARAAGAPGPTFLLTAALGERRAIEDPYFSGDFDAVLEDVARATAALVRAAHSGR